MEHESVRGVSVTVSPSSRPGRQDGRQGRERPTGCVDVSCKQIASSVSAGTGPHRHLTHTRGEMTRRVLLYWPNVVGYLRLCLVFAAWSASPSPAVFLPLYGLFVALDGVDGWLARRLQQTSRFGAWLDIMVDNLGRGMLWSLLTEGSWLLTAVEWAVFVCNHSVGGEQWKSGFSSSPRLVQSIMANGFRTPVGLWVVSGLHLLPVWLYAGQRGVLSSCLDLPPWLQATGTLLLAAGRLLALTAEVWCVWMHIQLLIRDEPEDKRS